MKSKVLKFNASERVIRAGDTDRKMFILLEGNVEIRLRSKTDSMSICTLNRGDFFGELSLFSNRPRTADVIATTDVKVVAIENLEQLKQFLAVNPGFATKMIEILTKRLIHTDELLLDTTSELNRTKIEYENRIIY